MKKYIILIVVLVVIAGGIFITKYNQDLNENACVWDENENIKCGKDWTLVFQGYDEYKIPSNSSVSLPGLEKHIVTLIDPNDLEEIYFLFLTPGKHIISEENSKKAISQGLINIIADETEDVLPNSADECESKIGNDKDYCYIYIAGETLDPSLCSRTRSTIAEENCYSAVALKAKDIKYCDMIEGDSAREYCQLSVSR
jgi:uncharacterized protein YxeA